MFSFILLRKIKQAPPCYDDHVHGVRAAVFWLLRKGEIFLVQIL